MDTKILVVDDEKNYLQTAMTYIIEESVPYALLCAPNGKVAIDIAINELPSIIIMDWEMPIMNGIEAIKILKKNDVTKNIPIIMATGIRLTKDDLKVAFNAGASDFIRKPLEKTEFISRISSHLKMAEYIDNIKKQHKRITTLEIMQLNREIEEIKSQKENSQTLLSLFTDTLQSINEKINTLDTKDLETKAKIQFISNQIKQSINYYSSQNKTNIDKPDDCFVKNLLNHANNLTTGEIKLCYMLRNNLSTKEIATLSFREQNSVKVARSRLRKKLGLKESENLVTFLEQF